MAFPIFFLSIILSILINLILGRLSKRVNLKKWIKSILMFIISCLLVFPITQLFVEITNSQLSGKSGGIGMIGVGIAAGMGVIISAIFFLMINFIFLIIRLIKN